MRLETLLTFAGLIQRAGGWEPVRSLEIEGISYDSRRVEKSDLFIAVRGEKEDGHSFITNAAEAGAAAAIVEKRIDSDLPQVEINDTRWSMGPLAASFWGNPGERLFTVGITGTNGKTTTMYLIRALLGLNGRGVGSIGTVEYRVGGNDQQASFTTPESVEMQRMLMEMVTAGDSAAVMEISSHALALGRVEGLKFDIACFTNLGRDHLDFHPSMDEYLQAKKTLLTRYRKERGTAVINIDDPVGARLVDELEQPILTAGITGGADVTADNVQVGPEGLEFTLKFDGSEAHVQSPLLGAFNLQNLLVAAAAGSVAGLSPEEISGIFAEVETVDGRMERLPSEGGIEIVLDYAHKPDALKVALQACREITDGRVIVVFGCGGDRDRGKRPLMGRIAALGADMVFVTSDNPRSEEPGAIIREIMTGVPDEADCSVEPDRRRAIAAAIAEAREGDVVLVAGKGHEQYQILGEARIPFDEREIVADAIARLRGNRTP